MNDWPALPLDAWWETRDTLNRWMQVVGKIRMTLTPPVNHWWHVPLYVSARGMTTSLIPLGDRWFEMEFDFIDHQLLIRVSDGNAKDVALAPRTVADFHDEVFARLKELRIGCSIWTTPVECENPIPLDRDEEHKSYDRDYAHRFWRSVALSHEVLSAFRGEFIGKCSPVHFFWGSFDLAVTRFSGRPAPVKPDADVITREAYSHEVISHGWWPGQGPLGKPAIYSYTAPPPEGLSSAPIRPEKAFYSRDLSEYLMLYVDVRTAPDPDAALLDFCQSTYEAGATLAHWDRDSLERS